MEAIDVLQEKLSSTIDLLKTRREIVYLNLIRLLMLKAK